MWSLILIPVLTSVLRTEGAIDTDLVTNLPGLTFKPNFKHYSGYLKATGTRQLHYWFVESQNNPSTDPVVLWLNGGPGCSSLDGMLSEHGPFRVSDDGKSINENVYAWNKVANVLYLEAPAGVGYSYATDKNYTTNDDQTSLDNLWALKYFLSHFPEFSKNEFFITGESYGGIYVPTLANRVMQDRDFNFTGFAVGNGLSDAVMNEDSLVYFGYYHGLYGKDTWNKIVKACCKNMNETDCQFALSSSTECQNLLGILTTELFTLNVYNLYAECYNGKLNPAHLPSKYHPLNLYFPATPARKQAMQKLAALPKENVSTVPPCINADGATTYLNTPEVRKALHIPDQLPDWVICSDVVDYHSQYNNMRNQYLNVLSQKKYRILVYNGDVDMACNYLGDEWFVNSLQQKEVSAWKEWDYTAKDGSTQVAGFVRQYQNITFLTVKGAGHMVPQNKPIPALKMFKYFIQGTPF